MFYMKHASNTVKAQPPKIAAKKSVNSKKSTRIKSKVVKPKSKSVAGVSKKSVTPKKNAPVKKKQTITKPRVNPNTKVSAAIISAKKKKVVQVIPAAKSAAKISTKVKTSKTAVKKKSVKSVSPNKVSITKSKIKLSIKANTKPKTEKKTFAKVSTEIKSSTTPKKAVRTKTVQTPKAKAFIVKPAQITKSKSKNAKTKNAKTKVNENTRKTSAKKIDLPAVKLKPLKKVKSVLKKSSVSIKKKPIKPKTINKIKQETEKTVTPVKKKITAKKTVSKSIKNQTPDKIVVLSKNVETPKQIKKKIIVKDTTTKIRQTNKTKPEIIKNVEQKAVEANNEYKPFLKDIKKRKKSKQIQQPSESVDADNYLFEKANGKKRGRRKYIKPVGSAVFRGQRLTYEFDTFDLKEKFEDFPAVFVISNRRIDRFGRGHHKIICVGQTESLGKEIAKHKKLASVKKNNANVVSILKFDNKKERLTTEENLRQRYNVLCLHD